MSVRASAATVGLLLMLGLASPSGPAPTAAALPPPDVPSAMTARSSGDRHLDSGAARDRFYVRDKHRYTSPWYAGAHRKMIPFGCTRAPYYPPSSRCKRDRGFHHGLDIAMPCGNRLNAGMAGWVVRPSSPGALGSAYGRHAFRLRNHRLGVDVVIGHVRRVYVAPGDRAHRGQRIARHPTRRRRTVATCTSRCDRSAAATWTPFGRASTCGCTASNLDSFQTTLMDCRGWT